MKKKHIYFCQALLVTQINNLIFYPLAMTLTYLCKDIVDPLRPSMLLWMLNGLLPLLLYVVRYRISGFFPLLAAHIGSLMLFGVMLSGLSHIPLPIFQTLANSANRILFALTAICFTCKSFYMRMKEKTEDTVFLMPVAVGVAAISLYLQHYQQNQEWDSYYILTLLIILGFYFVQCYLEEYLKFLIVNSSSAGILPEKEIFSSGLRLALLYTLAGTAVLFCTSQIAWLKSVLLALRNILRTLIRGLVSLFPQTAPESSIILPTTEYRVNSATELMPIASEPALIWKILEVIAVAAVFIGILVVLIKLLFMLVRFVKKHLYFRQTEHNEAMQQITDVREKCLPASKKKKQKQDLALWHFLDARERIRRIYKKKVEAYKPLSLENTRQRQHRAYNPDTPELYTAREMQREMGVGEFATFYEKARYSNIDCNGQDVRRMKELCKNE